MEGHTVHKLSQRRLTFEWLAHVRVTSRMHSKVSSDWLQSYITATRTVLEIAAGYTPDSPRISKGMSGFLFNLEAYKMYVFKY